MASVIISPYLGWAGAAFLAAFLASGILNQKDFSKIRLENLEKLKNSFRCVSEMRGVECCISRALSGFSGSRSLLKNPRDRDHEHLCQNPRRNSANCVKFIYKKQCELRQIYMQKTVQNAWNWYAKNSANCVKFRCKKTVRIASNLDAKNSANCVKFICKKTVRIAWIFYKVCGVSCR